MFVNGGGNMRIAGKCGGCGSPVAEGEFCYRLGERFWCRWCVDRAAVIAGSGRRRQTDMEIRLERQMGHFREREIQVRKIMGKAESGCRRNWEKK